MSFKETHKLPTTTEERMAYLRKAYGLGEKKDGDVDAVSAEGNIFFFATLENVDGHEFHGVDFVPIWPTDENGYNKTDLMPEEVGEEIHQPPAGFLEQLKRHPNKSYRWRDMHQA